ncbi:MAG: DNA polymerase I [Schwartzia sp. (in: firmicutes)]
MKRLLILDGSSLMFRAFYALPLLTAPTGEYTNAVFGFSNMLMKLLADYRPDGMVVAFDKSRHTFRTELYAAYKGTRQETPAEFSPQVPLLREMLDCFGIPFLELDGYEADDIIGTLATKAAESGGFDTFIVTGDRDALQLVRPSVKVLFTRRGISDMVLFDEAVFQKQYGFSPIRLIDLKGLMGDTSDNIPGVPGVGEKTATKLLLEYGSLEGVFQHLSEISGKKLKERLTEHRAQAELSKRLATIVCDVPVAFTPEAYGITPDGQRMAQFCQRYDLKSVQKGFLKLYPPVEEPLAFGTDEADLAPVTILCGKEEAAVFARKARAGKRIAFVGCYEGHPPHVTMQGAGLCAGEESVYAPADSEAWPIVWELLQDDAMECDTVSLKPFYHAGGRPARHFFDEALAAYLLDPEAGEVTVSDLYNAWGAGLPPCPSGLTAEALAAWQAATVFSLRDGLQAQLKEQALEKLYTEMELPLVEVLAGMEAAGIYVNRSHLKEQGAAIRHTIAQLENEIFALSQHAFNLNSPKQMGVVLFEELGLPPLKKTKKQGGYSTNVEVLNSLRSEHPIVEKILAYRMWTKLQATYIDAIDDLIDAQTQRVHTRFNQMATVTGRLSSSEPNLQNIPVRTEEGRAIRRLFEPGEGYAYLVSADYSQIELRLLAHLAGDERMIEAFLHEEDIHARTASEVFGVPLSEVTPELRRHAKAVNFGIVYGISDFGLAKNIGISRKEAATYIAQYFARYPKVKQFLDRTVEKAHESGSVTTMFGRRRVLPEIHSRNFHQRSLAERMAMNTPIQGSAADIIKLAMIAGEEKLRQAHGKSRILLQVHDELVVETTAAEVKQVQELLKTVMEGIVSLSVPLVVDVHIGKNWADAK